MKHRMTLSAALVLCVASLSLISSDSTAQAQQRQRFRADTGVVTLGPNQVLRIDVTFDRDVNNAIGDQEHTALVRFSTIKYVQGSCNSDGVCKHISVGTVTAVPYTLVPGEAASIVDIVDPDEFFGRVVVVSNRRNLRATATIMNTITGETTSHIIMANTEGDFH